MPKVLTIALLATLVASADDLSHVASLNGAAQQKALRALLIDIPDDPLPFLNSVFYYERRLRLSLRALLHDPQASDGAQYLLALIGVPEDLQIIIQLAPPPRREGFEDRWAYAVACALLAPGSELEWAFLRKAALNEYDDRWVDAGAIQTLKLLASPRSRQLLEETRVQNEYRAKSVARALEYIDSNPPPLVDRNLEELARRVALVNRPVITKCVIRRSSILCL